MDNKQPSKKEVQDYLNALNRVSSAAIVSSETQAAKTRGIANYRKWFKDHGILIHQERGAWKLVEVLDDIGVSTKDSYLL